MKVKDLKEFLDLYSDDCDVRFLAVRPKERLIYPSGQIGDVCVKADDFPVIGLELHEPVDMDEELKKAIMEEEENDA